MTDYELQGLALMALFVVPMLIVKLLEKTKATPEWLEESTGFILVGVSMFLASFTGYFSLTIQEPLRAFGGFGLVIGLFMIAKAKLSTIEK